MVAGVFFVDDSLKPITVGHFKSNENISKKTRTELFAFGNYSN